MADRNPYRPGAGRRPPVLAGRDELISEIADEMLQVEEDGVGGQPFVIWGLRGMGKTALLKELEDAARKRSWLVVSLEAAPDEDLSKRIGQAAALELRRVRGVAGSISTAFNRALSVLKSFQMRFDPTGGISLGVDVEPLRGYADSGNFAVDLQELMRALGEAARDEGVAVLVAIDELQEAVKDDLAALNRALHALGQDLDPVPLVFVGCGLPSLPAVLAEATSYAERLYRYFSIEPLPYDEARRALAEPATLMGTTWDEEALAEALAFADGYPYFIQQCGRSIWRQRIDESRITLDDCQTGLAVARNEIDRGLYRSRWERVTNGERELLRAMAIDDGASTLQELVERMGKKDPRNLSVYRNNLIRDGHIYAPARGVLAFTLPGMANYIRRISQE